MRQKQFDGNGRYNDGTVTVCIYQCRTDVSLILIGPVCYSSFPRLEIDFNSVGKCKGK